MAGRQTYRARCAVKGCPESAFYDGLTIRERDELFRRPWRCTRHSMPDEVLSDGNPTRKVVATARRLIERSPKLFWVEDGRTTGSGFAHGPGFRAFADDFPEGTRLVVTAAIEPPAQQPPDPAEVTTETEEAVEVTSEEVSA